MTRTNDERAGPMLNPPHLSELIRESMEEAGWTVSETAARLSCERGTLSRVLNGRAGVSANMALALESIGWGTAEPLDAHAGGLGAGPGPSAADDPRSAADARWQIVGRCAFLSLGCAGVCPVERRRRRRRRRLPGGLVGRQAETAARPCGRAAAASRISLARNCCGDDWRAGVRHAMR